MNPDLAPFQTLTHKLMLMGWISETGSRDVNQEGNTLNAIGFTSEGINAFTKIPVPLLIDQMLAAKHSLSEVEVRLMHGYPLLVKMRGQPPPQLPPNPPSRF